MTQPADTPRMTMLQFLAVLADSSWVTRAVSVSAFSLVEPHWNWANHTAHSIQVPEGTREDALLANLFLLGMVRGFLCKHTRSPNPYGPAAAAKALAISNEVSAAGKELTRDNEGILICTVPAIVKANINCPRCGATIAGLCVGLFGASKVAFSTATEELLAAPDHVWMKGSEAVN